MDKGMRPGEVYDLLEETWKGVVIHKMALELVNGGIQPANPAAYTLEAQEMDWGRIAGQLRRVLDELERIGKQGMEGIPNG